MEKEHKYPTATGMRIKVALIVIPIILLLNLPIILLVRVLIKYLAK